MRGINICVLAVLMSLFLNEMAFYANPEYIKNYCLNIEKEFKEEPKEEPKETLEYDSFIKRYNSCKKFNFLILKPFSNQINNFQTLFFYISDYILSLFIPPPNGIKRWLYI